MVKAVDSVKAVEKAAEAVVEAAKAAGAAAEAAGVAGEASAGFERAFQEYLLGQLPLAESVLMLSSHVLGEAALDRLYEAHRGRCHERVLGFPALLYLVRDALVEHEGSGNASFGAAAEAGELAATARAAYAKLGRMPMAVSMALLREAAPRLIGVLPEGPDTPRGSPVVALGRPGSPLARMRGVVLDGKTIKHVEKRLKVLRKRRGKVNSGKFLAALDLGSGLALAVEATANSEANDVSLVAGLLGQLGHPAPGPEPEAAGDPEAAEPRLFIDDRQFCDLPRLAAFRAGGHHFLVRHNANLHFHPDPERPAKRGEYKDRRDGRATGVRRYTEQWGWLGAEGHPLRRYVRRVTLHRPGERGQKGGDVSVVTDLGAERDEALYPAADLLDAYLERWGIERVFQQLTEVFDLRALIGSTPQATVFQACLCCVLYDITQVLRAYVARAGGKQVQEVSTEKLFEGCKKQLVAWAETGDPAVAAEKFTPAPGPEQVRRRLDELLGGLWRDRWTKAPRQAVHRKTKTTVYPKKGYTNTWKVREAERKKARRAERMQRMKRRAQQHEKQLA